MADLFRIDGLNWVIQTLTPIDDQPLTTRLSTPKMNAHL